MGSGDKGSGFKKKKKVSNNFTLEELKLLLLQKNPHQSDRRPLVTR